MIVWSDEAKINYEVIIDDLLKIWPIKIALDFESKTTDLLNALLTNKRLCPSSKYENLHKCVIHKNVSLIYKVNRQDIQIVTFIFNKDDHPFY